jgi:tetratricopeptide (TPR) repeat protein
VYLNALFKLAALLFGAWERNHDHLELERSATLNAELVTRLKAIAGEKSVEYAAALFNLGLCRKESETNDEALSLLEQAAAIYEAGGKQCAVQLARCLGAQSAVLRQLKRTSDAEAALLRALAALERDPPERIAPLQALADLYHAEQRSSEAVPLLEQAAVLASASHAVTPETRQTWARLALAYHRGGDFERARPFYERAFGLADTTLANADEIRDAGASPA